MLPGFMGNEFPYTNLNDINLDWIVEKIAELEQRVSALEGDSTEGGNE